MTSLYTSLVANAVFPLQELLKGHSTVRLRRAMEASQWWSAERLRAAQLERLRHFLADIGRNVPYYQDTLRDFAVRPDDIDGIEILRNLPFLTKTLIRTQADRMKATNARALSRMTTGGSSGEPLSFYLSAARVSHDVAAKWRATRWWGVDIGDPEIVLWGSPIELHAQDRLKGLRDRLMRTELLPAFQMSEERLVNFIERIRKVRPRMLFGYPSAFSLIAREASRKGIAMDKLGIVVAFVTSERLYPDQRERIERAFGCHVANGYGGRDAGFIAHECPSGGMHITAEDIIVEIVDASGCVMKAGEAGEVVVTHLASRDFPFVRYRTGDIAVVDDRPCSCGRGLPMLREIQGRSTDFVVARDGTIMHGLALIYVLRELEGIEAFKIVQETRELTKVEIVPNDHFSPQVRDKIIRGFKARLGEDVQIDVELVSQVSPERSGKHRYVTSKVAA